MVGDGIQRVLWYNFIHNLFICRKDSCHKHRLFYVFMSNAVVFLGRMVYLAWHIKQGVLFSSGLFPILSIRKIAIKMLLSEKFRISFSHKATFLVWLWLKYTYRICSLIYENNTFFIVALLRTALMQVSSTFFSGRNSCVESCKDSSSLKFTQSQWLTSSLIPRITLPQGIQYLI